MASLLAMLGRISCSMHGRLPLLQPAIMHQQHVLATRQVAISGQKLTPCDVAALQKCLQENKGDRAKVGCQ